MVSLAKLIIRHLTNCFSEFQKQSLALLVEIGSQTCHGAQER